MPPRKNKKFSPQRNIWIVTDSRCSHTQAEEHNLRNKMQNTLEIYFRYF